MEKIFDAEVRPGLAGHGGSVDIVDIDNDILYIKFKGGCHGCSASSTTVKDGIKVVVNKHFDEILDVIDITDHTTGKNPYM